MAGPGPSIALILLVFTLAPLVTGVALLILSRRGGVSHSACGSCGYDITSSVGTVDRCPECGGMFTQVGVVPPGRPRRPVMFGIGLALSILSVSCFGLMLVGMFFGSVRTTTTPVPAPAAPPTQSQTTVADAPTSDASPVDATPADTSPVDSAPQDPPSRAP